MKILCDVITTREVEISPKIIAEGFVDEEFSFDSLTESEMDEMISECIYDCLRAHETSVDEDVVDFYFNSEEDRIDFNNQVCNLLKLDLQ